MRILVTGGAGYIGSVVTARLLERGYDVAVLDDFRGGHRQAVAPGARIHEVDLADAAAVRDVLEAERPEAVMHFAGNIRVGESMMRPLGYVVDNVRNALNLLEAVVQVGVPKFVFSSTAALFQASDQPLHEDDAIRPMNPYAESKLAIEKSLRWLDERAGLRYAALRYFNASGAWRSWGEDHRPETHLIPNTIRVALGQAERVTLMGSDYPTPDGTCVRDYVHVLDLADAHIACLPALEERSRIYNLGNGRGFSVRQVVDTVRRVTGHPVPAVEVERRPGDAPFLVADSGRIREELGWAPRYDTLEPIVETAWEWHRAHPHGYEE